MPNPSSPGLRLRAAVAAEKPLQLVGTVNAYTARMAEAVGYQAIYLSGGGLAANSLGIPDLGISTLEDVLIDVRRITDTCALPLLVDADTGWGGVHSTLPAPYALLLKPVQRACILKIRWAPSVAVIARAKPLSVSLKW